MTLTNEQRAHEVALKFAELKSKQLDDLSRSNGEVKSISFSQLYIDSYKETLNKLNS